MIFRDDDINPSTNFDELRKKHEVIKGLFPKSQIICGVTLFGRTNNKGSVYAEVPFKARELEWFFNVNAFLSKAWIINDIASHGLIHFDHSKASYDLQEASIVTSCRYLDTDKFIPPFNRYNKDTIEICLKHKIRLLNEEWRNFEYEIFDPQHKLWSFHSWRWTPDKLKGVLSGNSSFVGQL